MWSRLTRRGGEIAVLGLGASGVAATRLLRAHGCRVYASDSGSGDRLHRMARELEAAGAIVELGNHDLPRLVTARLVILSPGVPPDTPAVAAVRAAGIEIWAEAELGLAALGGRVPYVAVTGTNGKTTTTTIAAHLLRAAGRRAVAAGNIGTPISEIAYAEPFPEAMAVELSSFQLHDMPTVRPDVGVLTNLAPDHLDRYPSLDAYYADKMRLFANASATSTWVTNADDPESAARLGELPGRRLRFSVSQPADAWRDGEGWLRIGESRVLPRSAFPLLGDHNVANALAAALAVRALGASIEAIADGLETVTPLAHRMEPVGERDGVLWINDSKATNVASTTVAVRAMDRPFALLLGGRHKGEPYTALAPLLAAQCRGVVAFGEARERVARDLEPSVHLVRADTFAGALEAARRLTRPGDAVLLSPACSSYDMFANYLERGDRFRAFVASGS